MMLQADPDALDAIDSPENILNQYRPPDKQDLPPGIKMIGHIPDDLNETMRTLFHPRDEPSADSPVDWSYLDAIERRQIDVSKFPKWAREFLDDIQDPEQRKYTEEMLLEQFSNKSLYDDAYFEEDDEDDDFLEEDPRA
jgi:hypothetical protein